MIELLLFASGVVALPAGDRLAEAQHAIEAGRLDQARAMLAGELGKGVTGMRIDRLLADLAFVGGKHAEAFARYEALLAVGSADALLLERATISGVKSGKVEQAGKLAERAVSAPGASWRAWNARGVIADLRNDFAVADQSYQRALGLAPAHPEALNNLGWSYLLRGRWEDAIATLERAVAVKAPPARAINNLELARSALASDLPRRRSGETDADFAARLNDAGVAARIRGERKRSIAAFAQAIAARGSWYDRAAKNLERAESTR